MRTLLLGIFAGLLLLGCDGGGGSDKTEESTPPVSQQPEPDNGKEPEEPTPEKDILEQALQSGDSSGLDNPATLLDAALAEIARLEAFQRELLAGIPPNRALAYPVPRSSHFIYAAYGNGTPILRGSLHARPLASAVELDGERGAGIGFEFFRHAENAPGIDDFATGLLTWLSGGKPPERIALAGIDSSALDHWLAEHFPQTGLQHCSEQLSAECLDGAQLLIFSDRPAGGAETTLANLLASARQRGLGALYVHTRGWDTTTLGTSLLAQFGMSLGDYPGNYFVEDTLDWSGAGAMLDAMQAGNPIKTALQHFKAEYFPVDWAACESEAGGNCDQRADLKNALLDGAGELRALLGNLDRQGRPLFEQRGQRLLKLLVLLGDLWRREIAYPMRKETTPTIDFMRALYADYSVHYLRPLQPAQPDLGSFSAPLRAPVGTATRQITRQVQGRHFTALGAYVPPGQPVRVTRNDGESADIALRINTQRTGSTRLWEEYSRPRFLASSALPLRQGQEVTLTSPYGGTLQLVHGGAPDPVDITLTLEGVARHPFLQYSADMDQQAFAQALQHNPLSWAEIRSPFAEVHSLRERMDQSINESRYAGDSQAFLEDLFEYMLRDAYALAGFQGDGVQLAPAVAERCSALNWDCTDPAIHGLPAVQHINVDGFAHCGAGCSGNPYDQSWPLDPYGWGESHELGHNLQRNRLNIHGGRSIEVSCNLFPLHKNWRLLNERGIDRSPDRIRYRSAFNILKEGAASGDPYQVAYTAIWASDAYAANNGERMAFYAQLPQLWREITGEAQRGWDLYTLLYLAERQFTHLDANNWQSERHKFGMGGLAAKPELSGNEFTLILASFLSGRDLRPLWDIWGVNYGSETAAQLDALALPTQESVIWVGPDSNDWSKIEKVAVSADMHWPF